MDREMRIRRKRRMGKQGGNIRRFDGSSFFLSLFFFFVNESGNTYNFQFSSIISRIFSTCYHFSSNSASSSFFEKKLQYFRIFKTNQLLYFFTVRTAPTTFTPLPTAVAGVISSSIVMSTRPSTTVVSSILLKVKKKK